MNKIIHLDMDSFYASIEARDDPNLRNVPLAIGGSKEHRGVVATCNYIARKYGVRSAMATAYALKLCPHLIVVSGNMKKYKEISQQVHQIFLRYTSIIEPLALDEAYLDVSACKLFQGSATLIAQDIRRAIFDELQLTVSAGVAPLKFLAKIASDLNKPNGIYVITPDQVESFIEQLPLGKISGVGKVTLSKLHKLGLYTGADVKGCNLHMLLREFGKFGHSLWSRCHGIDERKIETSRVRKSLGVEKTLHDDLYTKDDCIAIVDGLYDELCIRFDKLAEDVKIGKLGIKLKFNDFKQITVEHKYDQLDDQFYLTLLNQALEKQNERGIRLIGLSVGFANAVENKPQLSFSW